MEKRSIVRENFSDWWRFKVRIVLAYCCCEIVYAVVPWDFFLMVPILTKQIRRERREKRERGHLFEQRNEHTTGGYKLRSVLASSARCSAFGTFCFASTLRKTSCSRKSLGAISLHRSELLKSMVRTVLIIVVVECFGSCFPSSWFEVFGKDRFSLSQLVPIIKVLILRF